MPRPSWIEWEGKPPPAVTDDTTVVMITMGHPQRLDSLRDSLVVELGQSGRVEHFGDAYRMVHAADLTFGWLGHVDEDIIAVHCFSDGMTEDGECVDRPLPCVYAFLQQSDQSVYM